MSGTDFDVVGAEIHRKAIHNLTNEMAIALRRTSGSVAGARARSSQGDHRRSARPGPRRPARPARWSAEARETRSTVRRFRPLCSSWRRRRTRPVSITVSTPSTVTEVSATFVASTTRRRAPARRARSWCSGARSPKNDRASNKGCPEPSVPVFSATQTAASAKPS